MYINSKAFDYEGKERWQTSKENPPKKTQDSSLNRKKQNESNPPKVSENKMSPDLEERSDVNEIIVKIEMKKFQNLGKYLHPLEIAQFN